MPSNLVEGNVIIQARTRLLADGAVSAIVGTRVYDSHLPTVGEPTLPAVTLLALIGAPRLFSQDGKVVDFTVQLDMWVQADDSARGVIYNLSNAVRSSLHRWSLKHATVTVIAFVQTASGAILFEQDRKLWHAATRFAVTAADPN